MDSLLFAGTSGGGVYLSSDSGATWTPFNNGLPSTQVARLTSDGVYLYAGTLGGGLFRYGITTGVNELRAQHVGIRAYPVPCADVLTTTVHLTTDTELHAQLIDATGKVVAEQRRGRMPAGSHSLTWNVDQLVPGLYGCRVITGAQQGFVQVVVE
ncbi:MAG: T9SS type A sorting domain-containing protein [Flavobacteriales bacterium]|nr:T9SS type A sorting domain-containing protein [Flavobacteriales bacterium]